MNVMFDKAVRTEWSVHDPAAFFERLEVFFPQILEEEFDHIMDRLCADDAEYFEVPHYERGNENDPCLILVFDNGKTYIDFLDADRAKTKTNTIKLLTQDLAQLKNSRPMTIKDWRRRMDALFEANAIEMIRSGELKDL